MKLYNEIEKLVANEGVTIFLFGSKSELDDLCYKIVAELKYKYPYIDDSYRKYLLERYEDTYYPEKMIKAGKSAYVERNYEMIDNSSYCICYYDENYAPPRRRNSKRDLLDYQPKSGTRIAFDYATKRNLMIYNVFE